MAKTRDVTLRSSEDAGRGEDGRGGETEGGRTPKKGTERRGDARIDGGRGGGEDVFDVGGGVRLFAVARGDEGDASDRGG